MECSENKQARLDNLEPVSLITEESVKQEEISHSKIVEETTATQNNDTTTEATSAHTDCATRTGKSSANNGSVITLQSHSAPEQTNTATVGSSHTGTNEDNYSSLCVDDIQGEQCLLKSRLIVRQTKVNGADTLQVQVQWREGTDRNSLQGLMQYLMNNLK